MMSSFLFLSRMFQIFNFLHSCLPAGLQSSGSYPTVASHTGEWSLNPSSHSLDWSTALITPESRSGSLEFTVGGVDAGAFFPVKVSFVGQGSIAGVSPLTVNAVDGGEEESFSKDELVTTDSYIVV